MTSPSGATAPNLRERADALAKLAVWHFHDFKQFRILFYESADQLECLNTAAPGFFADLHRWLLDRIVLNVRKILDRPKTLGKDNLTVPALHVLCLADPKYPSAEAEAAIAKLVALASRIEPWRHHLVAHIDLAAALSSSTAHYAFVPSEIQEFYEGLSQYFDIVYRSLWNTVYPIDAASHSDSRELVRAVRDGTIMAELLERDVIAYDRMQRESRFGRH